MEDCIFCKIIKGEVPSDKVYEDDICFAFLSINPNNYGHTLLIPKKHYANYFETPDDVIEYLAIQSKRLGQSIKKAVEAGGMNIITNIERPAGQVVFHTHIHLIPRYDMDGHGHWTPKEYKTDMAKQIVEKIKKEIKN